MKKIILSLFILAALANTYAQDSTNIATADSIAFPGAIIIAKSELKFSLASAPLLAGNKIFIARKTGTVACYDTTLHMTWETNLNVGITSRPVYADGTIAVGDVNGDIFALDAKTGNQTQSIGLDHAVTSDLITFDYNGDIELPIPKPTGSKSVIVFATQDGSPRSDKSAQVGAGMIHCYDLETLQEYWTNKDAKDTVSGSPLFIDNKILFNSTDGFLYCIGAGNGLLIWRWKESAESSFSNSNVITDGKTIFVVSNNDDIFAIDFLLGKLLWKSKNIKVLPALGLSHDDKILYAETKDKRILFFSASEGKVIRAVKLEQPFGDKVLPVIKGENKLLFTRDNGIFSINNRYKEEPVLSFGNSPINFITQIDENKFLASNTNGTLIIFSLRNN